MTPPGLDAARGGLLSVACHLCGSGEKSSEHEDAPGALRELLVKSQDGKAGLGGSGLADGVRSQGALRTLPLLTLWLAHTLQSAGIAETRV